MKVKVLNADGVKLAVGKVYDVVNQKDNGNFLLIDEEGVTKSFKASRFEVVIEPDVAEEMDYKIGDILKDEDGGKYILVGDGDFVALVDMDTGTIENGFHQVEDSQHITDNEMSMIDAEWDDNKLVKHTGCGC